MIIPGANNVALAAQVLHGETPMQENVETVFPQITDATAAAAAAPASGSKRYVRDKKTIIIDSPKRANE